MELGSEADVELAGTGFPWPDAVFLAPSEILVDGALELAAKLEGLLEGLREAITGRNA